jgi:hypothetical protein
LGTLKLSAYPLEIRMALQNTNRRLGRSTIDQDTDSLNGLNTVVNYAPVRADANPKWLQQTYQAMMEKQQFETQALAHYRAASDAARLAEWEFHNSVLAMKESVRGQFGSDSDESQAIGYKKKSSRKRPVRKAAAIA